MKSAKSTRRVRLLERTASPTWALRVARPYATPEYIARIGSPRSIADLARAEFFGFERVDVGICFVMEDLGDVVAPREALRGCRDRA